VSATGSITTPAILEEMVARLGGLRQDTQRKWGTMTAGEMVCHLADCSTSILGRSDSKRPARHRPILKWLALYTGIPWPRGRRTPASVDPRRGGTRPGDFESDRRRAIVELRNFAAAPDAAFATSHAMFGTMTPRDWRHWACRHTDYHLKQFGL
jgi:hypothetical protein